MLNTISSREEGFAWAHSVGMQSWARSIGVLSITVWGAGQLVSEHQQEGLLDSEGEESVGTGPRR